MGAPVATMGCIRRWQYFCGIGIISNAIARCTIVRDHTVCGANCSKSHYPCHYPTQHPSLRYPSLAPIVGNTHHPRHYHRLHYLRPPSSAAIIVGGPIIGGAQPPRTHHMWIIYDTHCWQHPLSFAPLLALATAFLVTPLPVAPSSAVPSTIFGNATIGNTCPQCPSSATPPISIREALPATCGRENKR